MSGIQKLYFICAWIVAGAAVLATILLGIANGGLGGFGVSLMCIFLGVTGCITLLYLSGFFTSQVAIFITGIGVGCLALLSLILQIFGSRVCVAGWGCAWANGTAIAGNVFLVIFLGIFCTILLVRLSGKFGD
jgi:hypothetical protein